MKTKLLAVAATTIILASCGQAAQQNYMTDMNSLLKADKDASAMSEKQGMKAAMLATMDDSCVLLRPGNMPMKGNDAKKHLEQMSDNTYTLTWEPTEGIVAASGEMAYTYGIYTLHMKTDGTTVKGTYATIWRRQKDGKWKITLDTGNEGVDNTATVAPAAPARDTAAH